MSSRHTKIKAKEHRDWRAFWETVWLNLFHGLAVLAVLTIFGWIGWAIFGPSNPSPPPTTSKSPTHHAAPTQPERDRESRRALQILFNQGLVTTRPCATKKKNGSDTTGCSLFALRLGMGVDEAKRILDGSGYFEYNAPFVRHCSGKSESICPGNIYRRRDDFSVSADFAPVAQGENTVLQLIRVTLTLGPFPYQDMTAMRALFVKQFGQPDETHDDHLMWGTISDGYLLRAYPYSGIYWVILGRS